MRSIAKTAFLCGAAYIASSVILILGIAGVYGPNADFKHYIYIILSLIGYIFSIQLYLRTKHIENWFKSYTNKLLKEWGNKDEGNGNEKNQ